GRLGAGSEDRLADAQDGMAARDSLPQWAVDWGKRVLYVALDRRGLRRRQDSQQRLGGRRSRLDRDGRVPGRRLERLHQHLDEDLAQHYWLYQEGLGAAQGAIQRRGRC